MSDPQVDPQQRQWLAAIFAAGIKALGKLGRKKRTLAEDAKAINGLYSTLPKKEVRQ